MVSWCLTSLASGVEYITELHAMLKTFHDLHPTVDAVTLERGIPGKPWAAATNDKVYWILKAMTISGGDWVLWTDADSRFRKPVEPPEEGDIVMSRYNHWSTGTMWLRNAKRVREFLWKWHRLCETVSPDEEALRMTIEKHPEMVDMRELSREVCSVVSVVSRKGSASGKLAMDSAIVHWNMSRKRKFRNWPPPEEQRVLRP